MTPRTRSSRPVRTVRDRQREETRQRIFEAALDVFRRDGFETTRIEDIADMADVSRGAFYFHFPSKDDVLVELLRLKQLDLVAALEAAPMDTPLVELLRLLARAIATTWQEDPQMLGAVGIVALKLTASELPRFEEVHPAEGALARRFAAAAERGELPAVLPASMLADFFLVNVFAAALSWVRHPELPLELVLEQVVGFFLRGLGMSEG